MSWLLEQPWVVEALAYLDEHRFLKIAAIVVAALIVAKLTDWLVSGVMASWAKRSETDVDDKIIDLLHRPVFLTVLYLGLFMAVRELEIGDFYQLLTRRILTTLMILTWVGFILRSSKLLLEAASQARRMGWVQARTLPLFDNTIKLVTVGGAAYFLFLTWNLDVAGWLATAGIVGIAVGFAAKDTLANLFSGIFIMADAPYKVGDFVVLDSGERGQVTQVGLRTTRLLTRDDVEITLPNAVIANAKIVNESGGMHERERVRVKVGVAYGSDLERVYELLLEVAKNHHEVEPYPEPRVRFRTFGASSLDLELLCWIAEPVMRGRVLHALNTQVYNRFREEGIEIPFPQRDVYVRQVEAEG